MSLIVHRCTKCGASETHHGAAGGKLAVCPGAGRTEPVVLKTWRQDTKELVAELVEPGMDYRGMGVPPFTMCGCDACKALYAELGGVAA